ncbi:hypothetical protein GCM10011580_04810 [Plantactinospora veratri]|nr:hypothetical protein GCM10011580_04810 [Plantactinospora veratri]
MHLNDSYIGPTFVQKIFTTSIDNRSQLIIAIIPFIHIFDYSFYYETIIKNNPKNLRYT